jgi:hypothetical protein
MLACKATPWTCTHNHKTIKCYKDICVYVHIYMCVCIHTYVYTTLINIHTYMYVCVCVCVCVCILFGKKESENGYENQGSS